MNNSIVWYLFIGFILSLITLGIWLYKQYKNNYRAEVIKEGYILYAIYIIFNTLFYPIVLFFGLIYLIVKFLDTVVEDSYNLINRKDE